jgi:hypothetical protein
MEEKETKKKPYRIVQIEGKITWRIEELWDGGVVREPYASQHGAIRAEEKIAQENGFIDDLTLEEVAGEEMMPANAFEKNADGSWLCLKACSIDVGNSVVVFKEGMKFEKGIPFGGIDVTKWLDENYYDQQRM